MDILYVKLKQVARQEPWQVFPSVGFLQVPSVWNVDSGGSNVRDLNFLLNFVINLRPLKNQ